MFVCLTVLLLGPQVVQTTRTNSHQPVHDPNQSQSSSLINRATKIYNKKLIHISGSKMRATLLSITALLCSTLSATAAVNTDYSFQTEDAFKATRHNKKLRRARRALNNGNGAVVPSIMDSHVTSVNVKHAASKEAVLAREDSKIWNRLLDEEMSMNTRAPSFAPVAASPVADNAPTGGGGGGGNCPTSVSAEIDVYRMLLFCFVFVLSCFWWHCLTTPISLHSTPKPLYIDRN